MRMDSMVGATEKTHPYESCLLINLCYDKENLIVYIITGFSTSAVFESEN